MIPPALAFVSVSEEAWKAHAKAKMPRYYWDFAEAKKFLEKGQTPWTPSVSTFFGLSVALDMMMKEGLTSIFARHARVGAYTRSGAKALGLSLLADEDHASNTVTAVKATNGLDIAKMRKLLDDEHGIVIAGGQGKLSGKIFRIGHLGWVNEKDIEAVISVLKDVLPQAGFQR
jgi:aspartate aminotransferase-like enzyme